MDVQTFTPLSPTLTISRLLTGLWQIADMEKGGNILDPETSAGHLATYVQAGFTTFDMADHYGSAEIIAGHYKKHHSQGGPVQLLTKWVPPPGPVSRDQVYKAIERALSRLQVESIDLLQFHAWNYADPSWLDTLFYLQEIQSQGLIKNLGLTNCDAAHLQMVLETGFNIVSNQVCFSLIDQRAAGKMTEVCLKYGVKLLAFGVLAGGFLSEKWLGKPDPATGNLSNWSLMKYRRFIEVAGGWEKFQQVMAVIHDIALEKKVSIANLATRYILDQPAVAGVIIGARLGEHSHIESNRGVFQVTLEQNEKEAIQQAISVFGPIPGDCGDEYRKPPYLTASGDLSHHIENLPAPYVVTTFLDASKRVFTGTVWEEVAGFSRAIQQANKIWVAGSTATHGAKLIGGTDPGSQTEFILDKIEGVLQSLGAGLKDVVRTRIFIKNMDDWEAVAKVHGRRFAGIFPANTMVQAGLIGLENLVEIEVDAQVEL